MKIVIFGLSLSSSWGNGHATTFRGLVKALARRGHEVIFAEREQPWYAANRDFPTLPGGRLEFYDSLEELSRFARVVEEADCVMVGSYVPEGIEVAKWVVARAGGVKAFYDIDTPVTFAALHRGSCDYLAAEAIDQFDLYLSFSGGPILEQISDLYGAREVQPFHCAVDPEEYFPMSMARRWHLGYLGTYSPDRQPSLEEFLVRPALGLPDSCFAVAGSLYPEDLAWPENVERIGHLPPQRHRDFYNRQRYTLNITRADMIRSGYSPSVRLFEAAACGVPIVSDRWAGLETFFVPGREILVVESGREVSRILREYTEEDRLKIATAAREKVMQEHTPDHRAIQLELLVEKHLGSRAELLKEVA